MAKKIDVKKPKRIMILLNFSFLFIFLRTGRNQLDNNKHDRLN